DSPEGVWRMPHGLFTSIERNVDPDDRTAVADLILGQRRVRETVQQLVQEFERDVVGLSVMTFQRRTAMRIIELVRALRPGIRIVVGGYDPSLAPEAYTVNSNVDFIVRGEAELTFNELLRAIEGRSDYAQ